MSSRRLVASPKHGASLTRVLGTRVSPPPLPGCFRGAEAERASAAEGADPPPAAATGATRALFTTAAAAFSSGDLLRRDKVASHPPPSLCGHWLGLEHPGRWWRVS
jgi:hypothetical protein